MRTRIVPVSRVAAGGFDRRFCGDAVGDAEGIFSVNFAGEQGLTIQGSLGVPAVTLPLSSALGAATTCTDARPQTVRCTVSVGVFTVAPSRVCVMVTFACARSAIDGPIRTQANARHRTTPISLNRFGNFSLRAGILRWLLRSHVCFGDGDRFVKANIR